MVGKLITLTEAQRAQMLPHAQKWIAAGLATGPADREAFIDGARACYAHARLPWPHNVVWVSSPLIMALTVPLAARVLQSRRSGFLHFDVYNPLLGVLGDCGGSVIDLIRRRVYEAVHGAVVDAVAGPVHEAVQRGVSSKVEQAVDAPLHHSTRLAVDLAVRDPRQINISMYRAVQEAVRATSGERLSDELLQDALTSDNFATLHRSFSHFSGQFGAGSAAHHSFFRDVCALQLPADICERSRAGELAIQSACWWYAHRDFVLACERPTAVHLESLEPGRPRTGGTHRLHHTAGPALVWPDGWGLHAVHGLPVPGWIIEHPDRITVLDIERQRNAEVRRVMLDAYGWARFIAHCGAEVVDEIPMNCRIRGLRGARLLRKELPGEPQPIVYLDMLNSTPEADGTYRRYLERIDPTAYDGEAGRRCHAAMASRWHHRNEAGQLQRTFARWQDYQPRAES
jgi:hypothetical protein